MKVNKSANFPSLRSTDVKEIESKIGYTFSDKSLLVQAFTRASRINELRGIHGDPPQSNEVLEFFGDAVLGAAIVSALADRYTERCRFGIRSELSEGDYTNIKSRLSDKRNLSESLKKTGLQKFLLMSEGDTKLNMQEEPSVAEDLFESIVGAVFIDSGKDMSAVRTVIGRLLNIDSYVSKKGVPIKSYKNLLQEWCEDPVRRLPLPEYREVAPRTGPDHSPEYTVGCFVDGIEYGRATERSVKAAGAIAAKIAYGKLAGTDRDDHE